MQHRSGVCSHMAALLNTSTLPLAASAPQIIVKIVGVTGGARRKLLNTINVETQISVDS